MTISLRALSEDSGLACLLTVAMAMPVRRAAIHWLRQLAVRPNAGLRDSAPEQAAVAGRYGWVRFRPDEFTLPVQRRTQPFSLGVQMIWLPAAPPAFRMARLPAPRATWMFCLLC